MTNLTRNALYFRPIYITNFSIILRKYEFRNYPYEFHNGGSWAMVNGFFGLGLLKQGKTEQAKKILKNIDKVNQVEDYKFYENFNTKTTEPNGVPYCAWSAAASVLLTQSIKQQIKFI